ncbi:MAG: MFS transporter [Deltaproteobacteria bacterium]|nr:MFS transporter [Deltaproteobacteria bacterium]
MSSTRTGTLLVVLAYCGFVSLGLPDGLLGVATPSILATFALAPEDIGALLVAFTTGYLVSSFTSGTVVARLGVGTLLAACAFATATSLGGYATTGSWHMMLTCGVLSGLGAGAIDAGLNTWVATHHGPRTVNWLHACYGVGASAGPLVMTAVLAAGRPWRLGYALVGAGQLVLALCFAATTRLWSRRADAPGVPLAPSEPPPERPLLASQPTPGHSHASVRATLRLPAAWLGAACFFVYTGLEATTGVWAYSLLTEARGIPIAAAGTWVSAFWGGLTVGRFLFGFVAERAPLATLLRASFAVVGVGALLLASDAGDAASAAGLVLSGLGMAPIFPSLIATTPSRVGLHHTGNTVGLQVGAATLGASLLPAATGVLVGRLGFAVVAPAVVTAAVALALLHEVLVRVSRGPGAHPSG